MKETAPAKPPALPHYSRTPPSRRLTPGIHREALSHPHHHTGEFALRGVCGLKAVHVSNMVQRQLVAANSQAQREALSRSAGLRVNSCTPPVHKLSRKPCQAPLTSRKGKPLPKQTILHFQCSIINSRKVRSSRLHHKGNKGGFMSVIMPCGWLTGYG
jgi:hypothetical protein